LYGRSLPITAATPSIGQAARSGALDVRRRHVLARRVDDELLLAVDDADVSVGIDLGDVAGVQPPVLVDRLGGPPGIVAVTTHHQRTGAATRR